MIDSLEWTKQGVNPPTSPLERLSLREVSCPHSFTLYTLLTFRPTTQFSLLNSTTPSLPTKILLPNPFPLSIALLTHPVDYICNGPEISCECRITPCFLHPEEFILKLGLENYIIGTTYHRYQCLREFWEEFEGLSGSLGDF